MEDVDMSEQLFADLKQLIGLIGGVSLAICGIFQVIKSAKTRDFNGLSKPFIFFWFIGDFASATYIITDTQAWPLLFEHIPGVICAAIIGFLWFWWQPLKLEWSWCRSRQIELSAMWRTIQLRVFPLFYLF